MMTDYSKTVKKLQDGFGTGKTKSYEWRHKQLSGMLQLLEDNQQEIIEVLYKDLHKPEFEAVIFEIETCRNDLIDTLNNLREWMKPEKVKTDLIYILDQAYVQRQPYGVCLIKGSWNYPLQLSLLPMIGALAAGNCVLLKPPRVSWNTAQLLERLIPKYLDQDCVSVIVGGTSETTAILTERFDYIFYTGNPVVGKIVMKAASEHLTPVTLELGGKSPVYVDKNCDIQTVANRLLWGKTCNAGQTCIAPDYVMCTKEVQEELIECLKRSLSEFYPDDVIKSKSYGRIANERHFQRVKHIIDTSLDQIAIGGDMNEDENFISPTVLRDVKVFDPAMQEEVFGPILPIVPVKNEDEAITIISKGEKPLALYVFTNTKAVKEKFKKLTSSGGLVINDTLMHAAVMTLPFGGVGNSGIGAYHGKLTFDTFSHKRACLERELILESVQRLRYPPYTQQKLDVITWLSGKRLKTTPRVWFFNFCVMGTIAVIVGMVLGYLTNMYRAYLDELCFSGQQ